MNGFKIYIYTPAGLAVEDQTEEIVVPTVQGEIGVLTDHCRYTGLVEAGEVRFHSIRNGAERVVSVGAGFCTFADNSLSLLVDYLR